MIFDRTGQVADGFHVLGFRAVPSYLLDGPRPVLFDAGFTCLGPAYAAEARRALDGRTPEILFLSHTHFDHCGAAAHLKAAFPGLKVAASAKAADVLGRPGALKVIGQLSQNAGQTLRAQGIEGLSEEPFRPFEVDLVLGEGDEVDLGRGGLKVLATPGHTRDFLSYHLPELGLVVGSEALGSPTPAGTIISDCLVDFDDYLGSLTRLSRLSAKILCPGHQFVYTGPDAVDYPARSLAEVRHFREWVEELWPAEGGDLDKVMARIKAEEYDPLPPSKQTEAAYLINLKLRVLAASARVREGAQG